MSQEKPSRIPPPDPLPNGWEGLQDGADLMAKLMQRKLELVDVTYTEPGKGPGDPGRTVSLFGRLRELESRLEVVELRRQAGGRAVPDLSAVVQALGQIAEAVHGQPNRARKVAAPPGAGSAEPPAPPLPAEVTTAEAAKLLGVSKDTVLAYRREGVLPSRNLALPSSSKPAYMFPLEAVINLRTRYRAELPSQPAEKASPRRRVPGSKKYEHLDLDS